MEILTFAILFLLGNEQSDVGHLVAVNTSGVFLVILVSIIGVAAFFFLFLLPVIVFG
jgi:hypothetical protein